MEENEKKPSEGGFETLLKQNEIAEAEKKALGKNESLESRIIKNAPKRESGVVRSLRTLQGDVEEGVSKGKTTVVSVATAESYARKTKTIAGDIVSSIKSEKTKKIASYILLFILLVGGSGGLYYAYLIKQNAPVKIEREEPLVFAEQILPIDTTNLSSNEIKNIFEEELSKISAPIGSIVEIRPIKTIPLPENKTERKTLTTGEFFQSFKLNPPPRLIRSFEPKFMLGVQVSGKNQPFLLFKTTSYEIAFSDMLEWEKNIEKDTDWLFQTRNDSIKNSTSSPSSKVLIFKDVVFKNIDVRELKNEDGETLLIYAFPTKNILIISNNPKTLEEVSGRLTTRRVTS